MFTFTSFFKNPASNYFLASITWQCSLTGLCMHVAKKPPYSKHVYSNIAISKCYLCMYSYLFHSFSEKRRHQKQSII